jgi:hypothetical protein
MLPLSLDCPFLIAPSVFSSVFFFFIDHSTEVNHCYTFSLYRTWSYASAILFVLYYLFWYFPNPIRAFQCDTDASTHLLSVISDRPPYRSQGNTHISFLQDSSCAATITYNIDFDAIPELNCDVSCVWLKRGGHV